MKKKTKNRVVVSFGILSLALVYGTEKYGINIKKWKMVSADTMELIVEHVDWAPHEKFVVQRKNSLTETNWQDVAHTDTTNGAYVVTNLSYASNTTSNEATIYVKVDSTQGFFRVEHEVYTNR
jgi:hypothetical protein